MAWAVQTGGGRIIKWTACETKGLAEMRLAPCEAEFQSGARREPGRCWLWTGAKMHKGYGQIFVNGSSKKATHISLELDGRPRPSKKSWALHSCDTPECVNPRHLRWGSASENTREAFARGRMGGNGRESWTHCINGHEFTEENTKRAHRGERICRICEVSRGLSSRQRRSVLYRAARDYAKNQSPESERALLDAAVRLAWKGVAK